MKKLYKFNWGGWGELEGLFVEDDLVLASHMGKLLSFENDSGELEPSDITVLSKDPVFVEQFEKTIKKFRHQSS